MNYLKISLLFLLLALGTSAEDSYRITRLSESGLMRTYTSLLVDACHHAGRFWHQASFDPRTGYWGNGVSDGNEGIRAIGEMVLTCGTLLKYSDALSDAERAEYLGKATAAIRYAVATHKTGTQECPNGKRWGGSWQSALWAGTAGFGAWLLWDQLDSALQQEVERVIASEADRFLEGRPPGGRWGDTKAEENGWNLICISLAANMFPAHPHTAAWNDKAIEYMMNTLSAPQDLQDLTRVDGRPVREWVTTENLHPDFTLENHGFFHPSYVACSSYFLTQTAMHYTYAHRPVPQAATHHLMDTWKMLENFLLPWAESAFPQGMDWEFHGLSFINLFASLGSYQKDPLAARMEQTCLQYMRAWQTMCRGDLAVPGSRLGFTRHAICAEQAAYGYLAHKLFGPPVREVAARKAASELRGVRYYDCLDLVTHRTGSKWFSFSWKNRVMGLLVPIAEGHEGNPFFSVPVVDGFVGALELSPKGDTKLKVLEHSWRPTADGFETSGTLLLNGGRLRQTLRITSVGERTVVYQDCLTALAETTVARERGVPLGIENDQVSGGRRVVYHRDGATVFDWTKPQPPAPIPGDWANLDGQLGVVVAAGSGISYVQSTGYDPHTGVCADVLCCSFSNGPRHFQAGDQVGRRIVVLFVDVTREKTSALARSVQTRNKQGGQVLRLKRPEGGAADVPLL